MFVNGEEFELEDPVYLRYGSWVYVSLNDLNRIFSSQVEYWRPGPTNYRGRTLYYLKIGETQPDVVTLANDVPSWAYPLDVGTFLLFGWDAYSYDKDSRTATITY